VKIYLDSIGCRLNQGEIDEYARQLSAAGHEIVFQPGLADLSIINTCAVTASAVRDSRLKARQVTHAGSAGVVLTGCWSSLHPESAARLPGVVAVYGNERKDTLVRELLAAQENGQEAVRRPAGRVQGELQRTRAFIKVQDGCDNRCTFCVTTAARGPSRSRSIDRVRDSVRAALESGHKEVVLTGVQLGAWGRDLSPRRRLGDLLQGLLDTLPVPRLRLSSLEPWDLDRAFFELWQDERLCPHLHLPLQSGSAATLKRMNRRTTPRAFRELVELARTCIPGLAVTTDMLVGFPGEDERQFEESLAFVRQLEFSGGHVFRFSPRPGTRAAGYANQVAGGAKKERAARMRAALAAGQSAFSLRSLGSQVEVLWEAGAVSQAEGWRLSGWSRNRLRVQALAPAPRVNMIDRVLLTSIENGRFVGQIITTAPDRD